MNITNKRMRNPSRKLVEANEDNVDDDEEEGLEKPIKEFKNRRRRNNQRTESRTMLSPVQVQHITDLDTSARRAKR